MDKEKLKEELLAYEYQHIVEAEMNYEDFLTTNALDDTDVIDLDAQSHQRERAEKSNRLDHQIHEHVDHLNRVNALDFSSTDIVKPGAVVKVNDRFMFIGVAKPEFEFSDKKFIGISTNAPIYNCMHGKKAGDECQFNNFNFKIQEIY